MFEQENALPGSELHLAIDDRHGLTGACQDHTDVRWHVVTALGTVRKIIRVFRHETVEEFFEVAPCRRIGIFHDDHAATGMLDKDCRRPVSNTALFDL